MAAGATAYPQEVFRDAGSLALALAMARRPRSRLALDRGEPVPVPPTVLVDGEPLENWSPEALEAAVAAAQG